MKKSLINNALCALILAGALLSSCNNEDENTSEQTTDDIINQIPEVDETKQLSPDEQKNYLDQVGKAFMSEFSSTNFDNLIDLINFASEKYGDDYNWDDVESWAEKAFNTLTQNEKGKELVNQYEWSLEKYQGDDEETGEPIYKTITYHILNYEDISEIIYTASAFKGHFVAENGKWTSSTADDLQFSFADQNGKPCVLSLTTSGKTVDTYFGYNTNTESDSKENEDGNYTIVYTEEIEKMIVSVPENITVTLSQDGKEIIKTVIKTKLNVASPTEYDLTKDAFDVTTTTEIDGYTFEVSKASFSNKDKKSELSFILKKGNIKLLEYNLNVNGEISKDDDDEYKVNSADIEMNIDILGKVQIKGTSNDGSKLNDLINEAEENNTNETIVKEKTAEANKLFNCGMYFNGGSVEQSHVIIETFENKDWNGTSWDQELSIQFADGSKNSFGDFFIKANFLNIFNLWEDMSEDYENKIKVD